MSEQQLLVRYLGGESAHRAFFGGTGQRTRNLLLAVCIVGGLIATPFAGWVGIAVPAVAAAVVVFATMRTHRGSVLERRRARRRWRSRARLGTDRYVPFDVAGWDQLQADLEHARRRDRPAVRASLAAMRGNPDGADGMGWLQHGSGEPGIGWHHPIGEDPYLSVAFSVSGQLRGVESSTVLTRAAEGWGGFLAARAAASSLVGGVQTLTRVLPPDTARQQAWAAGNLDPAASVEEQQSYAEVIARTSAAAMVQRHFIVMSWPLTADFVDTARRYGTDRDGWRALMAAEIDGTIRGLEDARVGTVAALSARQTVALMLHQQDPSRPLDAARRVDPLQAGIASRDEFSAHIVDTRTDAGEAVQWWHRTAAIRADAMAAAPRSQLWVLDLLLGGGLDFPRSVSFHLRLVPAIEAKVAARRDVVRDLSDQVAEQRHGRLADDASAAAMTAAQRRRADLAAGTHHQGVEWIGYVTISATTRDGLALASRQLAEVCTTGLGIDQLDWLDTYQSAASGTTWPIGRGLRAGSSTFGSRVYRGIAGHTDREAIA
jgi:hypothetical protein